MLINRLFYHTCSYTFVVPFSVFFTPSYWWPGSQEWWKMGQLFVYSQDHGIHFCTHCIYIVTINTACHLEVLIEDFLSEFLTLCPERPLVPKMHYLVHVPSWIRRYTCFVLCSKVYLNQMSLLFRCGPLAHCWCMCYEAKHKYFKKIIISRMWRR